jgi:predicted site-specific integrase-resolvase
MLRWILSDPDARVVVVQSWDRLARFGVQNLMAVPGARGRGHRSGVTTDDLVRDMIGSLNSICARLYVWRDARNWAVRALTAVQREPGEGA